MSMSSSSRTHRYDQRWADRGNCSGLARLNPRLYDHIFFPERGHPSTHPVYEKFCSDCPVRSMCYKYALVNELDGIWGNTTKAEREALPEPVQELFKKEAMELGYLEKFAAPNAGRRTTANIMLTDEFEEVVSEFLEPQDFVFDFMYEEYLVKVEHMIVVIEDTGS